MAGARRHAKLKLTPKIKMLVSFNDRNEVESVRVGEATFATGGGDLWTAWFSSSATKAAATAEATSGGTVDAAVPSWPIEESVTDRMLLRVGPSTATSFRRTETGDATILFYGGIALGDEPGALDATVRVAKRPDGSQAWGIRFENRSRVWALHRTAFPRFSRVVRDGEGDALIPKDDHGARLYRSRRAQPEPEIIPYPAYHAMVCAFFIGDTGLYIAAEDPDARIKRIVVAGEQCIAFEAPVENAGRPGLAAEGPRFEVVLAPLKGDWWEAARRYRAFALRQKWAARGPIRDNPAYPRRLCEIPLWINIHAYPEEAERIRLRVKAAFPDFHTGIHWHLWQHSGHDENYPEYFPEHAGTADVIARARADGQEMLPYANGRLWSMRTGGYEVARPFAVLNYEGTRRGEIYHPATPPLAAMCPCCEPWQRVVRNFTSRILDELGSGALFLDQIGSMYAVECHDPSHNHATGGGPWWYDGYARMMDPIRRMANARGAFVTTEGAGEYCLGMVDGYMQLTDRTPFDVPFWNAVYSGYTTYFCSPENIDDDDTSFRALQTRELLWGNALGWFLPEVLDRPAKCEILRRLCAFRQENLDALAYGTLLDALRPAVPIPTVQCAWHGRRPNFGLFDKGFALPPATTCEMPAVIGNWWRTAGGETVLLAANLTDDVQTVCYRPFCSAPDMPAATATLTPHGLRRISGVSRN